MTISQIYSRDCSGEGGREMGLVVVVGPWGFPKIHLYSFISSFQKKS